MKDSEIFGSTSNLMRVEEYLNLSVEELETISETTIEIINKRVSFADSVNPSDYNNSFWENVDGSTYHPYDTTSLECSSSPYVPMYNNNTNKIDILFLDNFKYELYDSLTVSDFGISAFPANANSYKFTVDASMLFFFLFDTRKALKYNIATKTKETILNNGELGNLSQYVYGRGQTIILLTNVTDMAGGGIKEFTLKSYNLSTEVLTDIGTKSYNDAYDNQKYSWLDTSILIVKDKVLLYVLMLNTYAWIDVETNQFVSLSTSVYNRFPDNTRRFCADFQDGAFYNTDRYAVNPIAEFGIPLLNCRPSQIHYGRGWNCSVTTGEMVIYGAKNLYVNIVKGDK